MITLPYLVAICAVTAYALLGPMAKKIGPTLPPFSFVAISTLILCVISGVLGFIFEREKVLPAIDKIHWYWLVVFSLVNVVAYVAYLWAINRVPVVHYEMLIFISPIIAGLFALFLLDEPFHLRYIPALAFMLIGLVIAIKPWGN